MCLLKAELPAAIWPHTDSFSTPQVSKVKTQAGVCLCVCMCLCLDKQVKNVSGGDPSLPQAHLGIFVAPSKLSASFFFFFRFLSDRSDSSGWLAWVLRKTAPQFVCMYPRVCVRVNMTPVKASVSLVFCWCLTALCRGAGLELKSFFPHVAWALQRLEQTNWSYSCFYNTVSSMFALPYFQWYE